MHIASGGGGDHYGNQRGAFGGLNLAEARMSASTACSGPHGWRCRTFAERYEVVVHQM